MIRHAMAPRFAIKTVSNIPRSPGAASGSYAGRVVPAFSRGSAGRPAERTVSLIRSPDHYAHRRRVVRVARVVELRAVGDQHDHVYVRTHLHVATRRRDAVRERQIAGRR